MSIRTNTPCDLDGECPYGAMYNNDCEYWCGADDGDDYPPTDYDDFDDEEYDEEYEDFPDDEVGFNPYEGAYDYDC